MFFHSKCSSDLSVRQIWFRKRITLFRLIWSCNPGFTMSYIQIDDQILHAEWRVKAIKISYNIKNWNTNIFFIMRILHDNSFVIMNIYICIYIYIYIYLTNIIIYIYYIYYIYIIYTYILRIYISYISYEYSTVRWRFVRFEISKLIKKNVSLNKFIYTWHL